MSTDEASDVVTPRKLRLVVVDDHALVRKGLVQILSFEPDLEVMGEAGDGNAAIALVRQVRPDVVLVDISMPQMDGIELTQRLLAEFPDLSIIGLSMFDDAAKGAQICRAGAVAYVTKGGPVDDLLAAIRGCASRRS